ncbi:MAG: hypothetical protein NXH75_14950 [Halobacteriovoraceae bacterium]|nr:hypothetical protein [Halobacteriovoraceae bacterium]
MAKKKIFLTDKQKKELEGFEDALDLIGADGPEIKQQKDHQIEDYEIYDFLEKENLRLEKLDHFFTTHIPLDRKYSQTEKLINKEKEVIGMLREDILDEIQREDNIFQDFMKSMYQKAYSD